MINADDETHNLNDLVRAGVTQHRDCVDQGGAEIRDEEEARAAQNVAEWRKFLPQDCIDTMVKEGWHRTV